LGEGIPLRYGEGMRALTKVMCIYKPRRGREGMEGLEMIGQYCLEEGIVRKVAQR